MERKKYILFRIFLLLAFLVNSGVTVYSEDSINTNSIELTPTGNAVEPGNCTEYSLVVNDQTDAFYNFRIAEIPEAYPGVLDDFSIIHNFCVSVWHPPKIS